MEKDKNTIQDQLIEARRNQILDAATKVFAERGFQRATIKDVAKAAGVADGTIYNYFENKTALLIGLLDRMNQSSDRAEHFEEGLKLDPEEFFAAYFRQRLEKISYEEILALLPEVLVNPELRELYYKQVVEPTMPIGEQYIAALVERGEIEAVDTPLLVRTLAGMTLGLLILRLLGDETLEQRWDQLPDLIFKLVFEGVSRRTHDDRGEH